MLNNFEKFSFPSIEKRWTKDKETDRQKEKRQEKTKKKKKTKEGGHVGASHILISYSR